MRRSLWRRVLVLVLRFQAVAIGAAFLAVFMPTEWMAKSNDLLGLAPLPRQPLIEYLTRSLSMLYGLWGSLNWVTSRDIDRFAPVITYVACGGIVLGLSLLVIDFSAGLPLRWAALEWIVPTGAGILVLTLQRLGKQDSPT